MTKFFNFPGAKITETRAATRGEASGGNMTRLRCGKLPDEIQQLFDGKVEWSVAILSEYGIIPTLFYVLPKKQSKNNQSSLKKRKLEIVSPGKRPDLCTNFNNELSVFQVINHYCPDWDIRTNPPETPSIVNEFVANLFFMEDGFSNRGLIMIHDPNRSIPLLSLEPTLKQSASYHLANLNTRENAGAFIDRWHDFLLHSTEENDIEQKRDDLEKLGIQCYFKRQGVDSPASKVVLKHENRDLEFSIDIELKHDSKSFFTKKEASNIQKYPRLPMLIISNLSSATTTDEYQKYIHPTLSLLEFITYFKKNPLSYMAMVQGDAGAEKIKLVFNPKSNFDRLQQKRLTVAGTIINEMTEDKSLGRIKLAKILYIVDTHLNLGLEGNYVREKYGPFDQRWFYHPIYNLEVLGLKYGYFSSSEVPTNGNEEEFDESRIMYNSGINNKETRHLFQKIYKDQAEEILKIIEIFKRLNTSQSEIVATLFACWNDRIIKKKTLKESEIIHDFLNDWHDHKKKYKEPQLKAAIAWMKENLLEPKGTGRLTVHKQKIKIPDF